MSDGRDLCVKEECEKRKFGNSSTFVELRGRGDRTTSSRIFTIHLPILDSICSRRGQRP